MSHSLGRLARIHRLTNQILVLRTEHVVWLVQLTGTRQQQSSIIVIDKSNACDFRARIEAVIFRGGIDEAV